METEELFRLHSRFVARFAFRLGAPEQDIEDIVQEVFVIAHRHGGYVAGPARPTTWLAKIAMGVVSSRRRTRRRHPEDASDDVGIRTAAPGADPAEAAETAESLKRVHQAIEHMDLERRTVFVLFELEEESCEQIAAGLGIPIGTVYSRLHAARKEFTAALERLHAAERPRPRLVRSRAQP